MSVFYHSGVLDVTHAHLLQQRPSLTLLGVLFGNKSTVVEPTPEPVMLAIASVTHREAAFGNV